MHFFTDTSFNGGTRMSKRQLKSRIEDLYGRLDDENERREELLFKLSQTERAIERWQSLLADMEALLK